MSSFYRTALRVPAVRTSFAARSAVPQFVSRRFASSDYGSSGHPQGDNPKEQGANPREDLEHPGPPAPDVGQAKGGKSGQDTSGTKNLGSGEKGSGGTSSGSSGGSSSGSNDGASVQGSGSKGKPTKLSAGPAPAEHELPDDVRAHNEDMQSRKEQSSSNSDKPDGEKVDGGKYWKGESFLPLSGFSLERAVYG